MPIFNYWVVYDPDTPADSGNGEINSPFNGRPLLGSPVTVALHNDAADPREALGTASAALADGDIVIISGVVGNDADKWNGTFRIYGVSGISFKYRMLSTPAVVTNPMTGLKAEKILSCPLDNFLNTRPKNSRIYLGPTPPGKPFMTRGYCVDAADSMLGSGWQLKGGTKLVGAGIDTTVVQLVLADTADREYYALAHDLKAGTPSIPNPLDGVEVSDLTIDCNIDGQPQTTNLGFSRIACGAVRLMGSHCRVNRVKVVNWGTKTEAKPCRAISMIVATGNPMLLETVNSGIENCIAVFPSHNGVREATAFHMGGIQGTNGVQGCGRSPFIRNNFVDGTSRSGGTLAIVTAESVNGTIVALKRNHCRTVNEFVRFSGPSGWNGYFRITGVPASPPNALQVDPSCIPGTWSSPVLTCGRRSAASR